MWPGAYGSLGTETLLGHNPCAMNRNDSALADLDERLGDAIAGWVDRVMQQRERVVAACLASTLLIAAFALPRLRLDSDEEALFAKSVGYHEQRNEFQAAFPALVDPIVVVVEAASVDLVDEATRALRERLLREPERFPTVYQPGGGDFFERNGLLYLETGDLEELADRLIEMQPYLGTLAHDPTLRGFFSLLGDTAEATLAGDLERLDLAPVLDRVSEAVEGGAAGATRALSWAELLLGREPEPGDLRRLILVQAVVDYEKLDPAGETLEALRAAIAELGLDARPGVRVRLTGTFPLAYEESRHVTSQVRLAGVAALAAVSLLLAWGLRSRLVVFTIVATLCVALVWTAGFAALAIGSLNLISVAFAVLMIGLSVDFGIHMAVRYRELLGEGGSQQKALREAARSVGGSLVVCSSTTAFAFYAFVPTDFRGIAQLGAIAGTGMFVSLFLNLTLLPALLALGAAPAALTVAPRRRVWATLLDLPARHPRLLTGLTILGAAASATLLPRVHFDLSPLRVRDPSTESVQTFEDLLADGMAFPWNVSALASNRAAAGALAVRLEALDSVERTLRLDDYVPVDQEHKLEVLEDAGFLLLPTLEPRKKRPAPSAAEQLAAIVDLQRPLARLSAASPDPEVARSAARLRDAIAAARARVVNGEATLATLEVALLGTLPNQLRILRTALRAEPVSAETLPAELWRQSVAADGQVRVEVFPSEDLNDNDALRRYVESVTALAPNAFGEGIVIHESGRIVVSAFRQALVTASVVVLVVLVALWRNLVDAALAALPLALAALFTASTSVLLDVPFNFANVIVIPLLLGMGVDSGVHLVHRIRYEPPPEGNLLRTGTAHAVVLSALTTIASFGALALSTHRGMASLGQLLALGIAWILACNLVVLPAVLVLARKGPGGVT